MESRLDDLETRYAYQEAAVETLTRTVMEQQQQIEALGKQVEYLMSLLKDLTPSAVAPMSEEAPPPHY